MVVVSGATGNVGRPLVEQLLVMGCPTRVLVRNEAKVAHLGDRVEKVVGDLDVPESLEPAMQGADRLYFVTAKTDQVVNLLEAAREAGVKHVVKQSTIEADRGLGPGLWHRQQEELIKSMGFQWTFLRPTMMMVNTINWWSATVRAQHAVFFPGGHGKVAPVDPRDIAAVACAALTDQDHVGQTHEVTGPEVLEIRQMVEILGNALGTPLRYVNVPTLFAVLWLRRFGMSRRLVKALAETLGALRRNEYAYTTDVVERIGGIQPTTFQSWCLDHAASFQ